MSGNTIAAIATAPGKASLCTVRISGDDAFLICERIFKPINESKKVTEMKGYTALFGNFYRKGNEIDQAVALFFRAPKSYTGENVVEISVHGGSAVADLLLKACYEAGAKPAGAGEFTKRAFLNGKMSLTQAEGVMEMINATSAQAVSAARSALEGHLYKRAAAVRDKLLVLVGHISAYTDFPEEAVEAVTDGEVAETLADAGAERKKLLESYDCHPDSRHDERCGGARGHFGRRKSDFTGHRRYQTHRGRGRGHRYTAFAGQTVRGGFGFLCVRRLRAGDRRGFESL